MQPAWFLVIILPIRNYIVQTGGNRMSQRKDIHKVLIIGSGPIIIGQACEFDYSGTQACKALRKLGYEIVLVNSNPATIMTDPEIADVTYIEKEIDGLFNEYHVRLNNGTEIEFDQQGNLEHIDCHKSAVPEGIVPQLIVNYVNLHFSNQIIVEYHREDRRQQVELNNGLELVFDREGNFLRMDD
mgnify:CR=1 FL=1